EAGTQQTASAQPDVRDHRKQAGPTGAPPAPRERRVPASPDTGPREAPPAPKAETPGTRAGYVWVPGPWDWKNAKWEWVNGHWERERAGKKWREARWEQKGGKWTFVAGGWIDAGDTPTPGPGRPGRDDHPREAPPSPREEKIAARAGYVWISG